MILNFSDFGRKIQVLTSIKASSHSFLNFQFREFINVSCNAPSNYIETNWIPVSVFLCSQKAFLKSFSQFRYNIDGSLIQNNYKLIKSEIEKLMWALSNWRQNSNFSAKIWKIKDHKKLIKINFKNRWIVLWSISLA